MPLHRVRDVTLIAAGVSVTAFAVVAIVLILVLYPRVSRAATNLEQASAAVVVAGNLETVTNDMVAVTGAIRAGADRIAQAADHISDAGDLVRTLATDVRQDYEGLDLKLGDLSGQMERFRNQADQVDALLSRFGR